MKNLMIVITNEDLKIVKAGIEELYQLLSKYIGETYNPKLAWLYDLYSFIYEKLKFEDIK